MTQATYFMRLDNPSDLRRQVLENSKSVIESLKRFDKIGDLRAEKMNHVVKLKQILSELHEINSRLRSSLPQPKMSPVIKGKPVRHKMAAQRPVETPKAESPKQRLAPRSGDLDKLESELSDIESKLSRLE